MNKMSEIFERYVQTLLPVSIEKGRAITAIFEGTEIQKNGILIQETKISQDTFFLECGIVRSFTYDQNGEEVTTDLFAGPCFVNDFLSFFRQEKASETFQALVPCQIWKANFEQVQKSFHTIPEFRKFGRMMLVSNYARLHARTIGMIKDTAETRYLRLMKEQPDIIQHVPLKYIASYLGITDSSLSRIRREIM